MREFPGGSKGDFFIRTQFLGTFEERPLRSIGEVAAVIVCLGYWGISAVTWLTSTPEAQATLGN